MKKNDESAKIAYFISDFLNTYAPTFLTNSRHTLKSYKDSLVLYLSFLETENIKPDCFSRECFERAWLEKWILWLKETRQCSADTCNVRLGSLRVFLEYLGEKDIEYLYLYQEAKKIKRQKCTKKKVCGLTRNAVAAMLSAPDLSTRTGKRDVVFLTVLYATAGRLDEIRSIKISHIHLDEPKPYIILLGKGGKMRTAYLLPRAVANIRIYLKEFHGEKPEPEAYLFIPVWEDGKQSFLNPHLISGLSCVRKSPMRNVQRCHLAHMPTNSGMRKHPTGLRMALVLFRSAFCLAMSS